MKVLMEKECDRGCYERHDETVKSCIGANRYLKFEKVYSDKVLFMQCSFLCGLTLRSTTLKIKVTKTL